MRLWIAALVASAHATMAWAQPASKTAIVPKGMEWAPNDLHFSPAVRSGDLLFVSGVTAGAPKGATTAQKEAALDDAFKEIGKTLSAAGAGWDDVVQITSYHTDFTKGADPMAQQALFRSVKDRYVKTPYPAWTAVGVTRLWQDDHFAEISVVARVPAR